MVLLGSAAIFGAGSYTVNTLAASGVNFEAFAAYKIMAIAVAIIAPYPIWLGYFIILLSGTLPLLHFFMLPTELHRFFSIQEPWYSLLYAVLGLIILIYRHKSLRLEQRMARIAAEKNALSELAAILLMLRDLTNTPLQSLEITSYLLKEGQMNPKEGSAHLERALVRLRELTRELSLYGHHVDWSQTGASFDAIKRLRQHYSKFTLEHETAD